MRSAVSNGLRQRTFRLLLLGAVVLGGLLALPAGDASATHFRGGNFSWVRVAVQTTLPDGTVGTEDWGTLRMSIPVLRHSDGLGGGESEDIDIAFASTSRTETDAMLRWARASLSDPDAGPVDVIVQWRSHGGEIRTFNLIDTFPLSFKATGGKGGPAKRWRLEVRVNRIDMA